MNSHRQRTSGGNGAAGARHRAYRGVNILLGGVAAVTLSRAAQADNFAEVHYSARTNQLIVTMAYRGTNPDHRFSLKWGQCQQLDGGREIAAEVLDSQSQDVEQQDFKKTTRFSLADLHCRPAKVTLRTAPRFFYTLEVPAVTIPP